MLELTNSDYEVFKEMKSLEMMIAFHRHVISKGGNVDYFTPLEIPGFARSSEVTRAWDDQDYNRLRYLYAKAWITYYESIFKEPVITELSDVAEMFARDE